MEMVDENGESGWDDEKMNVLPINILPTKPKAVHEGQGGHKPGYSIPGGMSDNQENREIRKKPVEKKAKWGPVKAKRRSARISQDGRTSLEKA
jgi:hypothetical protein